ncbi:DUF488 family protein [Arthrobacter agilis]|uniref:DUF488 domain-containing protein n=1 Tax=Arthrobacter agilis TaxID=37921 RepID=UPI003B680C97
MKGPHGIIGLGHGRRSTDSFTQLLRSLDASVLIDVRTYPDLPARPDFAPSVLGPALIRQGIRYRRIEVLSGAREHECLSVEHLLQETSDRGFERHMQSKPFQAGLAAVIREAGHGRVALMCAERRCRCHRRLIEQALTAHGIPVTGPHDVEPFHSTAA